MTRSARWAVALALSVAMVGYAGCGGDNAAAPETSPGPGAVGPESDAGDGTSTTDATTGAADGASPSFNDGTPTRIACTNKLGHALSAAHGRLDGQLVAIVPPGKEGCPSDSTHLHLQVRMNGDVYDIAVNLDGFEGETDAPLPGVPYAEGWHEMALDYVSAFNLHSNAITLTTQPSIQARLMSELANANHISVFGTGYPGSDGAHLIHRKVTREDGALVLDPLGAKPHVLAFRFDTDTF
jgi:hypothetical protein